MINIGGFKMICGKCGMENKELANFCLQCGETLNKEKKTCSVCHSVHGVNEDYCPCCHTFVKPGYKLCKRCETEIEADAVYCSHCKTKNKSLSPVIVKLAAFYQLVLALSSSIIFIIALIPREVGLHYYYNGEEQTRNFTLSILDGDLYPTSLVFLILGTMLNAFLIVLLLKIANMLKRGDSVLHSVKTYSWLFPILIFITSMLYNVSAGFLSPWFEVYHPLFLREFYGDSNFLYEISIVAAIVSLVILFINLLIYFISLPKINRLVQRKSYTPLKEGEVKLREKQFFSYEKDNLALLIFLCIITFGIYHFIWVHKTTKNLKRMNEDRTSNAGIMVMFILLPLYNIYWYYKYASKAYLMFHKKGVFIDNFVPVVTLLSCFVPILNFTILASKMNDLYDLEY
jgi:hypothetical protein